MHVTVANFGPMCLGFIPLEEHGGALVAALIVGVAIQESMRLGFWMLHRYSPNHHRHTGVLTVIKRCQDTHDAAAYLNYTFVLT